MDLFLDCKCYLRATNARERGNVTVSHTTIIKADLLPDYGKACNLVVKIRYYRLKKFYKNHQFLKIIMTSHFAVLHLYASFGKVKNVIFYETYINPNAYTVIPSYSKYEMHSSYVIYSILLSLVNPKHKIADHLVYISKDVFSEEILNQYGLTIERGRELLINNLSIGKIEDINNIKVVYNSSTLDECRSLAFPRELNYPHEF